MKINGYIIERSADLRNADLCHANLRNANLHGADLRNADLRNADLRNADLRGARLNAANLRGADLRGADLRGADLRGANLDFSSGIPFHWGGTGAIADDRLFAQMLYHLTRLDVSKASGGIQESMEAIRNMAASDLFCEYRSDVSKL